MDLNLGSLTPTISDLTSAASSALGSNGAGPTKSRAKLPNGYERAYLQIEGGNDKIECWFNPKDYSITKANTWQKSPVVGESIPPLQFGGGQPRSLSLNLIFDDSDSADGDVRVVTNKLFHMMEVDSKFAHGSSNKGRPPMVTFIWGNTISFKAVCDQIQVQFTMFRPNGVPIRCSATVGLTQAEKITDPSSSRGSRRQNPTTSGLANLRTHTVRDGDSLPSIAHGAYGDPTKWRTIADANGIDDPTRLRRGASLAIPPE
jgi:Contractile injection system tube protein/LysM domain